MNACFHCGAIFNTSEVFCRPCLKLLDELLRSRPRVTRALPEFVSGSLLEWLPSDKLITNLLESLKGGGRQKVSEYLALHLVDSFRPLARKNILWVPAPAKKQGHIDHAVEMAISLQRICGGELFLDLRRSNEESQKSKSREDRKEFRCYLDSNKTYDLKDKQIVFVDDIITTGSTAFAAYMALGRPKDFFVMTIANRPWLML